MDAQSRIADDGPDVAGVRLSQARPQVMLKMPAIEGRYSVSPGAPPLAQPTDAHYATLAVQPIECVEAWSPTWDARVGYHLGESVQMIARCGTRGQAARDLRKSAWLLLRAADIIETGKARPAMDTSPSKP